MRHTLSLAAVLTIAPMMALAVGGDDETPPTPTETMTECADGQIFDDTTQACVDATDDNAFNDDARYDAVRELAYAGAYERAL
ncbi:unnamed protein product, partial [Ectocarpus sp. 12 AP-2014]